MDKARSIIIRMGACVLIIGYINMLFGYDSGPVSVEIVDLVYLIFPGIFLPCYYSLLMFLRPWPRSPTWFVYYELIVMAGLASTAVIPSWRICQAYFSGDFSGLVLVFPLSMLTSGLLAVFAPLSVLITRRLNAEKHNGGAANESAH